MPRPTAHPGGSRRRMGEDAADGELHVRHRVGDDGGAALGDQRQLVRVEPDAVGEHGALAQHPQSVEVEGRPLAVLGDAVLDLFLGLGEVDLDRQVALGAELADPAQRLFADGVDRVGGEGGGDVRAGALELLEAAVGGFAQLLGTAVEVEERGADRRADAGVGDRAGGRRRMPVHVPEAGGAAAHHLGAGEPGAPVDVLVVELRLDRPDLLFQPRHQRQVAAGAAEERHRRVGVAVDQRRHQVGAAGVDRLVAGLGHDLGADRLDRPARAAHPDPPPVQERVRNRQRHPVVPLSGYRRLKNHGTISPPPPGAAALPPVRRAGARRWRRGRLPSRRC